MNLTDEQRKAMVVKSVSQAEKLVEEFPNCKHSAEIKSILSKGMETIINCKQTFKELNKAKHELATNNNLHSLKRFY